MKTVYFEPVNGCLVRMYQTTIYRFEIDKDKAVAKGLHSTYTQRNHDDIKSELKSMGIKVVTWERYDECGRLLKTSTVKL